MSQFITVDVANQPQLMREFVLQTIMNHPDIEIAAEIQNEEEMAHIVDETRPDFPIIALDESGQRPALCDTLLRRYPEMKMLALNPRRNIASFFWASFGIHSSPVESSEDGILSTLLQKAQSIS
jgi:DNA-binding NarL/FixJ family response regulator